ncbi:hypothetical protein EHE19_014155 [Ruminiclostridium herbifermentans]|uniref:Uncharacterized protein n=1 Tax=Ruminiclostridium herbifermentans TaxID=2488810 RepID=A0A4U7JH61_9FIRM|nr:hypothetical protein [Ruminiclostridium herbifermentans]QNU66018.1 hypothetical protein EHE19_014155 [Ruminiclostridium herbifermentans]
MYKFIVETIVSSIDPEENDAWMDFDEEKCNKLLNESFFDEYNKTIGKVANQYKRKYPLIELYAFTKLQSLATTMLTEEFTVDINYIWTFEDLIVNIYELGWYDIISTVYKAQGIHWFCNNGENDPIMYKWACYAVSACKRNHSVKDEKLKSDLADIYSELLIAFTIRNSIEKNNDIINYVKESVINFDDEKINAIIDSFNTLKKEHELLIDEKRQLNEGIQLLREQIKELQGNNQKTDFERIEEIAYRVYCLSPQDGKMSDKVKKFEKLWNDIDENSRKDIKLSISIFEKFKSFDLAIFPMIRSLEHEFVRHIFEPFYNSQEYKNVDIPICKNKKIKKTHESLIKKKNVYPTLGNIPFIGIYVANENAKKASNLINAFDMFLGDKRNGFIEICKILYTHKIGERNYKLVDIRNGIAHGDDDITRNINKKCYEEISHMLYEPPLQILYKVIENSKLYF